MILSEEGLQAVRRLGRAGRSASDVVNARQVVEAYHAAAGFRVERETKPVKRGGKQVRERTGRVRVVSRWEQEEPAG